MNVTVYSIYVSTLKIIWIKSGISRTDADSRVCSSIKDDFMQA